VLVVLAALLPPLWTQVAAGDAFSPLPDVAVEPVTKGLCLWQAGAPTVTRAGDQRRSVPDDTKEAADQATGPTLEDQGNEDRAARIKGDFRPIGPFAALAQVVKVTRSPHPEEPAEAMLPTFLTAMVLCLLVTVALVVGRAASDESASAAHACDAVLPVASLGGRGMPPQQRPLFRETVRSASYPQLQQ